MWVTYQIWKDSYKKLKRAILDMTDPNSPPSSLSQEVEVPESISGLELVRSVRSPIRLVYDFVPSPPVQEYLRSYSKKKILGHRSPIDGAVFVPPRGVDPRHGVLILSLIHI